MMDPFHSTSSSLIESKLSHHWSITAPLPPPPAPQPQHHPLVKGVGGVQGQVGVFERILYVPLGVAFMLSSR